MSGVSVGGASAPDLAASKLARIRVHPRPY